MKFLIDNTEIKTVISGAVIEGSLSLAARNTSFSYIYNPNDSDFAAYKAKNGSSVVIKNDDGENIFKGYIVDISYQTDKHLINVYARDVISLILSKVATGRFRGTLSSILSKILAEFDFSFGLDFILEKEINILSLGGLSYYDIIVLAVSKLYGDEFKIYIDGNCKLKILLPIFANSKGNFTIGQNILSSSFSAQKTGNIGRIKTIGNEEVVSGSVIKVIDNDAGISGYFTVIKDRHIYTSIHTMELEIKERKISL